MPKGNNIKPAIDLKSKMPKNKYSSKRKSILVENYKLLQRLRIENSQYLETLYRRILLEKDNKLKILILRRYKIELLDFIKSNEIHVLDVLDHLRNISFVEYSLGLNYDLKNTLEFALELYKTNFNLEYLNRIGVLAYAFGFKDLSASALFMDRLLPGTILEEISLVNEKLKASKDKENTKYVLNNLLEFIETTEMRIDRLSLFYKIANAFLRIKDFATFRKLYLKLYDYGMRFELANNIMLSTRHFLAGIKLQLEHVKLMKERELTQNLEHIKEFIEKSKLNLKRYGVNKVSKEDRRMDLINLKILIEEYESIIARNSDNSTLEPFSAFRNNTEELN